MNWGCFWVKPLSKTATPELPSCCRSSLCPVRLVVTSQAQALLQGDPKQGHTQEPQCRSCSTRGCLCCPVPSPWWLRPQSTQPGSVCSPPDFNHRQHPGYQGPFPNTGQVQRWCKAAMCGQKTLDMLGAISLLAHPHPRVCLTKQLAEQHQLMMETPQIPEDGSLPKTRAEADPVLLLPPKER